MYQTDELGSTLQYGAMWDFILLWLESSGYNVRTNSSTWGNYKDSQAPANVSGYGTVQKTGYSENWKANNIYDLAGNLWEFTQEILTDTDGSYGSIGTKYNIYRGAGANIANIYPATSRYGYPGTTGHLMGFSTIIYKNKNIKKRALCQ